jgi:hypothetical protein
MRGGKRENTRVINDDEIIWVFKVLLGYRTVPDKMIETHRRFASVAALRRHLMGLPQFRMAAGSAPDRALATPLDTSREVFIFQHVPKCAGTSLHNLLETHLGPAFAERHNGLGNWPAADLAQARFFSGHYDTPSLALIPPARKRVVTVLRAPQDRLLSLYRFLRAITPAAEAAQNRVMGLAHLARGLSPLAFFSHPAVQRHPGIHNGMTRQFAGVLRQKYWESAPAAAALPDLTSADLDRALAHLESLDAVGIVEFQDQTLPAVFAAAGLPRDSTLPRDNDTSRNPLVSDHFVLVEKPRLTRKLQAALDPYIEIDLKLYYGSLTFLRHRAIL